MDWKTVSRSKVKDFYKTSEYVQSVNVAEKDLVTGLLYLTQWEFENNFPDDMYELQIGNQIVFVDMLLLDDWLQKIDSWMKAGSDNE